MLGKLVTSGYLNAKSCVRRGKHLPLVASPCRYRRQVRAPSSPPILFNLKPLQQGYLAVSWETAFMESSARIVLFVSFLAGTTAFAQPATSLSADDRDAIQALVGQ